MRSSAHCGSNGMAKNFNPANSDGANIRFPAFKNSDSSSLLKQPGSMLNVHFITFSVVKRTEIYEKSFSNLVLLFERNDLIIELDFFFLELIFTSFALKSTLGGNDFINLTKSSPTPFITGIMPFI